MDWNNINTNKDTSGLGPIEYDQSKVPSLIRKHADNVRGKSYGQQVRESQARNAEYAGLIASKAENVANNADLLSKDTQNRFKDQIEGTTNSDEVIDARRPFGAETAFKTVGERLDYTENDLQSRGINAMYPPIPYVGIKGDGIADDTKALQALLDNFFKVFLPFNCMPRVTDTLKVGNRWRALVGSMIATDDDPANVKVPTIIYDGVIDRHKTVIQLGANVVDSKPINDSSGVALSDIIVDANNKAGFGVYGTYLTNESTVNNVIAKNALEYDMYFAKSWYARFTNLTGKISNNNGIALGMPLEYLDGQVMLSIDTDLEMNNTEARNIRSIRSGTHFSEGEGRYTPFDINTRRKGYGLGFGVGNGFIIERFTAEQAGGADIYVYNSSQPTKVIRNGYIEKAALNSGLDNDTQAPGIIVENTSATGETIVIEDMFISPNTGGGIYHTGVLGRKVRLKNIHIPKFLKSLDGLTNQELYSEVLKENVSSYCGLYNTDASSMTVEGIQNVNTRYSFRVSILPTSNPKLLYIRAPQGGDGSYTVNYADGTSNSYTYPTNTKLEYIRELKSNAMTITKGASGGATADQNVEFVIVSPKPTYY